MCRSTEGSTEGGLLRYFRVTLQNKSNSIQKTPEARHETQYKRPTKSGKLSVDILIKKLLGIILIACQEDKRIMRSTITFTLAAMITISSVYMLSIAAVLSFTYSNYSINK